MIYTRQVLNFRHQKHKLIHVARFLWTNCILHFFVRTDGRAGGRTYGREGKYMKTRAGTAYYLAPQVLWCPKCRRVNDKAASRFFGVYHVIVIWTVKPKSNLIVVFFFVKFVNLTLWFSGNSEDGIGLGMIVVDVEWWWNYGEI